MWPLLDPDARVEKLKEERSALRQEIKTRDKRENGFATRITHLKELYDEQLKLRQARDQLITHLKDEREVEKTQFTNLETQLDTELARGQSHVKMIERLTNDRDELRLDIQTLHTRIHSLETHAREQERGFLVEMTKIKDSHNVNLFDQKQRFEISIANLIQSHKQQASDTKHANAQKQEELQQAIQSRNKALIARENIPPITDGELKSMFSNLIGDVDDLARLKWTFNHSPWTDQLQSQIQDSPKKLQKHILQDTIWATLLECVFASPFRVLGDKGKDLEVEWSSAFGIDPSPNSSSSTYTYPPPTFDSETFRYHTLRSTTEALRLSQFRSPTTSQPTSSALSEFDPRHPLVTGYHSTLKHTRAALTKYIGMVSPLDSKTESAISKVVEAAAQMWVAFGTQRCRLLVVAEAEAEGGERGAEEGDGVQGEGGEERGKTSGEGRDKREVELMIQPELRRVGDADGQGLDNRAQTIVGYKSEVKNYYH